MNEYEIKGLKKIIEYTIANYDKAVSLETMIEYVQSQTSGISTDKIKNADDSINV